MADPSLDSVLSIDCMPQCPIFFYYPSLVPCISSCKYLSTLVISLSEKMNTQKTKPLFSTKTLGREREVGNWEFVGNGAGWEILANIHLRLSVGFLETNPF